MVRVRDRASLAIAALALLISVLGVGGVLRWTQAVVAGLISVALGLLGAFLPAWRVRRMEPYALIQAEAR